MTAVAKRLLRLDLLLVERGLSRSRTHAQGLIGAGKVRIDGHLVDKAGRQVSRDCRVELIQPDHPFVGRGGLKLAHALDHFSIDVAGLTCLDVGASTGGFTDCLLQRGAALVYAVDVGYGQLDWSLRNDERVVCMERTNIRRLPPGSLGRRVEFAAVDTSFISLRLVVPSLLPHLALGSSMVVLVKPQFEVGKGKVGKGGVVRDAALHQEVIEGLERFFGEDEGLEVLGTTASPILGAKGNREFLMWLKTGESAGRR
jgi:23S rRNA (cytidine1920-2'-O)/16S rRNA (cytidine1409-2'-O)-methyltransferase